MSAGRTRRPRPALPYTVLTEAGVVRLVAGEDARFTLRSHGLETWLPALLARCDGRLSIDELLAPLDASLHAAARQLIERLYGERVLVDGSARDAHRPSSCRIVFEGDDQLVHSWASREHKRAEDAPVAYAPGSPPLHVLCQDRLDLDEALRFNRRMRGGTAPWLWVSTGAMGRGYVSPVFLPDAGPCLGCLVRHFRMLSPAPEVHDALIEHVQRGGTIAPVPFPEEGIGLLVGLVFWKARLLGEAEPPAVLYWLHVLEIDTMEVTTHRVFIDPECPECGRGS